jgi:hypothetical protein
MARGKGGPTAVLVQVPENDKETAEPEPQTSEERQAEAELAMVEDANPRSTYGILYRVDRRTGKRGWLGKVDLSLLTNDYIADECGGGKYIAILYKPNKTTGGFEYAGTKTFDIEDEIPRRVPSWHMRPRTGDGSLPAANGAAASERTPSMFETMALQMMTQQMNAQNAAQESSRAQQQAAQEASRAQMQMQFEMMRAQGDAQRAAADQQAKMMQVFMESMRASMSSQPKLTDTLAPFLPLIIEFIKQRKDPMEIVTALAPLFQQKNDPGTTAGMLALIERGMNIGERMSAPSGEPANGWDIAREALRAVPEVASAIRANAQARPAAQPNAAPPGTAVVATSGVPSPNGNGAPPAPLPAPMPANGAAPASAPPAASPTEMLHALLKPIVPSLVQLADANADPEEQAEIFFGRYGAFRNEMLSFTAEPNYQYKLLTMFPELQINTRPAWCQRFMTELAELVREPAE